MDNEVKIFNFLERSSIFLEIAKYQRNYSWTKNNWSELWIDVERMAKETSNKHFLNTIITYGKDNSIEEIVDGQQRVITFAILCIALKNYFIKAKTSGCEEEIDKIDKMLIDKMDDKKCCRLILKDCDKNAFDAILNNTPSNELSPNIKSHSIYKAYNFFTRQIINTKNPKSIYKALLKFNVSILKCDTAEEASTTFARINSTGLIMKEYEQVNAFVYQRILNSHLDKRDQAELTEKWLSINNNTNFSMDFLLFCCGYANNMFNGRVKSGFSKIIMRTWEKNNTSPHDIVNSVYAIYEFWKKPSKDKRVESFINITSIVNIPFKEKNNSVSYVMPMLIIDLFYKEYGNKRKINVEDALSILQMAEDIILKRRICKNTLDGMYVFISPMSKATSRWLNNEGNIAELFKNAVMESHIGRDLSASIPTIKSQLELTLKPSVAMFILQKINAYYSEGEMYCDGITLEHIVPKKYKNKFDFIDKLGNLTLLYCGDNSSLKDCDYNVKKETYLKSGYAINKWFENVDTFDESTVNERTQFLIEQFFKVFPMFIEKSKLIEAA